MTTGINSLFVVFTKHMMCIASPVQIRDGNEYKFTFIVFTKHMMCIARPVQIRDGNEYKFTFIVFTKHMMCIARPVQIRDDNEYKFTEFSLFRPIHTKEKFPCRVTHLISRIEISL
jgi:hydrogenase maturation factor